MTKIPQTSAPTTGRSTKTLAGLRCGVWPWTQSFSLCCSGSAAELWPALQWPGSEERSKEHAVSPTIEKAGLSPIVELAQSERSEEACSVPSPGGQAPGRQRLFDSAYLP